jgi:hypothetical protein
MIKNLTFLALIALFIVNISSCQMDEVDPESLKVTNGTPPTTPGQPDPVNTEYFITYEINGVAFTATEVSAVRGTTTNPRTLTITGTAKNGASPKVKFSCEETLAGFQGGLTIISSEGTYPTQYFEYTNSSNVLFTSSKSSGDLYFGFLGMSYKNGGEAFGIFSGDIITTAGKVEIENGKFKVKFSN